VALQPPLGWAQAPRPVSSEGCGAAGRGQDWVRGRAQHVACPGPRPVAEAGAEAGSKAARKAADSRSRLVALVVSLTKWSGYVGFTLLCSERNKCVPTALDILMFLTKYGSFLEGKG